MITNIHAKSHSAIPNGPAQTDIRQQPVDSVSQYVNRLQKHSDKAQTAMEIIPWCKLLESTKRSEKLCELGDLIS